VSSNQPTPQAEGIVTAGAWFDVRRHRIRDDVIDELASRSVVLLGETHDDDGHHRWQFDTVTALADRRQDIALGFEMFPRRVQPVVDRWSGGQLDEASFLAAVDWPRIWGFDPELYMPLFRFARSRRLPMLALNVDRETNRRVAAARFSTISVAEREGVGEPAPASQVYRDRLRGWFGRHPAMSAGADEARFERFVRAQTFWDRAMAEAIAAAVSRKGEPLVIGIMGSGHIEYGDGAPHQLAALGIDRVVTALPWPAGAICPTSDPPVADFVFGEGSLA
jgi:uncharacterized iron-regulated protein